MSNRRKSDLYVVVGRRRSGHRKRIQPGLADSKRLALFEVGVRLLAEKDFDDVSIARLAREADCAVGSVYVRFTDKAAFLRFLIQETFAAAAARADRRLALPTGSLEKAVQETVGLIVDELGTSTAAGVVRAAVKLGGTDPFALESIVRYRQGVADRAAVRLAPYLKKGGEARAREAMQIVFASLIDAILMDAGPMALDSVRFKEALGAMALSHVRSMSGATAKSVSKPAEPKTEQRAAPGHSIETAVRRRVRLI